MRISFRFLFSVIIVAVIFVLSGCGNLRDFESSHRSNSGILLEEAFPANTWFFSDFSTLEIDQKENFQTLLKRFSPDPDAFRQTFLEGVDANLKSIDLSYVEDIQPIFGANGFRFALGLSGNSEENTVTHAAVTVDDPQSAMNLFKALEEKGRFLRKQNGNYTIYFNANASLDTESSRSIFYFILEKDVLLIANDESAVVAMANLLRSAGAQSLWTQSFYRDVVDELPADHLFSMVIDGDFLAKRQAALKGKTLSSVSSTLSGTMVEYLAGEGLSFRTTTNGLEFRGIAKGDRERIKSANTSLDLLKAGKAYLAKDMASEKLAIYLESHDLGSAMERQLGNGFANMGARLGLEGDFSLTDLLSEGYAFALHGQDGILPGVTLMIDVSDFPAMAKTLVTALDEQVKELLGLFQFQGGELAKALSREEIFIEGQPFYLIRVDVEQVMAMYDPEGLYTLPIQMDKQDIIILYGVTKRDRFLLSTYDGWVDDERGQSLAEADGYKNALAGIDGFDEGVVYVDFDAILPLVDRFQRFRGALRKDTVAIQAEETAEGEEGVGVNSGAEVSEEEISWADFLKPLKGFAFSSKASKYKVELGGTVLLK